jgi:hypothetical protein
VGGQFQLYGQGHIPQQGVGVLLVQGLLQVLLVGSVLPR